MTPVAERLDEDQSRLVEAAASRRFELRQARKAPLEAYRLTAFEPPDAVLTRLTGEIEGAPLDLFEVEWVARGSKGATYRGKRVMAVLRHPSFAGEARCTWEHFQGVALTLVKWTLIAFVLVAAFWLILPLWFVRSRRGERTFDRDWRVGDAAFDRRFRVDGPSQADARRALPRAFQSFVVERDLRGPIEVRPGMLAVDVGATTLDPEAFERALALSKAILAIYAPPPGTSATAYRVAGETDAAAPLSGEAGDDDEARRATRSS